MRNLERIIFIPLGDKTHENLEMAACYEAWKLTREIREEEDSKGRKVVAGVESLQKLPGVNPFFYLKKRITAMGGYLVEVKEVEVPQLTKTNSK